MTINYIANDPRAAGAAVGTVSTPASRPAGRVNFQQSGLPAQAQYSVGTNNFVAWQAREAALRAVNTFETICGPLTGWRGDASVRSLNLFHNNGIDLNAYYDRSSVAFFQEQVASTTVFSGASTDVVAHEVGHAILDAVRPDLWGTFYLEIDAFHEGFGDVIAIMTALADIDQRSAVLLADPTLGGGNAIEMTAEELSWAIAQIAPNHNAAAPRRGLNTFRWILPDTLPTTGGPGVLIQEAHSLGQLVSGVYYDLIREIYRAGAAGEIQLWTACQTATRLLVDAVRTAPLRPRFIQSVGRTMLLNDWANGGANDAFIRAAHANHGISVSASTFLAPQASLAQATDGAPAAAAVSALTAPVKKQLKSFLAAAPTTRFVERVVQLGGQALIEATAELSVDLSSVSTKLQGVVTKAPQPALVGRQAGAVSVLGGVDTSGAVADEVQKFVKLLVKRGQIAFPESTPASNTASGGAGYLASRSIPSHAVVKRGGKLLLERQAFVCCGCARR